MQPKEQLGTFVLKDLINDILHTHYYRPISQKTAEIIFLLTHNKHTCYIQFPGDESITGEPLQHYVIWDIEQWHKSAEKYRNDKIKAQERREKKFIYDANIKRIAKAIVKFSALDYEIAQITARRMLDDNDLPRIKSIGVKQLYTNVKELP